MRTPCTSSTCILFIDCLCKFLVDKYLLCSIAKLTSCHPQRKKNRGQAQIKGVLSSSKEKTGFTQITKAHDCNIDRTREDTINGI